MREVSPGAIGVVVVGPETLPFGIDTDRTMAFTFNNQGKALGRFEGPAAYSSRVLAWKRGFTTATAQSVLTVTTAGTQPVPIDENMIEGASGDPATGRSMFWFNTGRPDGPEIAYRNNYVITGPEQPPVTGSVPGMMLTGGFCTDTGYGVVVDFDDLTAGLPSVRHELYELPGAGGEAVLRGEWEYPADFRAVSRTDACSADGRTLYNLYGSVDARRGDTAGAGLRLVRIDTTTGTHSETAVDIGAHPASTRTNTLTVVDERLYWISSDGAVLSLPLDHPSRARQEWALPANGGGHTVTITGTTVSHLDHRDTPTYTEYDLLTGQRTRDPIELPWLTPIINSRTESGKAHYAVTGIAGLPQ
ncbi:hypothetical protein [Nocardia otitidiscaviarum]|uniref:hypothetical protein n=1 Tax=Nocardia otitidiscaviarum TaxID=1823 RepID=UPI0024568632|nr:hypothetical protein [Nocardia otitidiscaviarum]